MLRKTSAIIVVKFRDLNVKRDKIVSLLAEELEFEFIADLNKWVHPVHLEVIKLLKQ
jgi:hypothetical protein